MSEFKIINGSKKLIVSFGGMLLKFSGIPPFEFLNYLSSVYNDEYDLMFYIDVDQCWYHKGIKGITTTIDETIVYLNSVIKKGDYEKVIFLGTSAGGYASILFGSLCDQVSHVVSFKPQTLLENPIDSKYADLKTVMNDKTKYTLCGDVGVRNKKDVHHFLHCKNLESFENVKILKIRHCSLKHLRDTGFIKQLLDNCGSH